MSFTTGPGVSGDKMNYDFFKNFFFFVFLSFFLLLPSQMEAQLIESHNKTVKTSGDVLLVALPTSVALTTLILDDKKGSWQFAKGFVANVAVTTALKYAINKRRPYHGGYQAFPSGHTSVTFQSASFIHRRYGFKYALPAYALAAWTGYSRINATRHDGYDVLAGAAVGIGSSLLFTTPYQREHINLEVASYEDGFILDFTYRF